MPYKEKPITKLLIIGDVAKLLKVYPSTITFWEREYGLKNNRRPRKYTPEQIEDLKIIQRFQEVKKIKDLNKIRELVTTDN